MGPWTIRELCEPADVLEAAQDVEVWGFPRPVHELEVAYGVWFRMGRGVVWWYEGPREGEEAAHLHLCVAPRLHGRWPVRRWHYAVQLCAELMGARSLLFRPASDDLSIVAYAERIGWTRAPEGCFVLPLGGQREWESSRMPA